MPILSIIIPTFNRAALLELAIESILRQEFSDFEIVISDNASTDNTKDIVEQFIDPRIKYYRNVENLGVLLNHNLALEKCQGEFIHIFSDDDIMLPNCISMKMNILNQFPNVNVVHSDIVIIDDDGDVSDTKHWANFSWTGWRELHSRDRQFSAAQYLEILYNSWNIISMPSVMIRKNVIDNCGGFQITPYSCDWLLWMKSCAYGDFYYINRKLIQYRFHDRNVTHEGSIKRTQDDLFLMKREVKLFIEKNTENVDLLKIVKNHVRKSDIILQVDDPFGWFGTKKSLNIFQRLINKLRSN
jgi:glycosyltransferase involved in cell wall biosynthesis